MKTNTYIKIAIAVLTMALLSMCVFGCKKPNPRQIQFRLNKGNCDFEIWEYRSSPKEVNRYHTGIHISPYSDYLPYRPGFTYDFIYYPTNGAAIEGEILIDGKSVAKSTNNSVTYK